MHFFARNPPSILFLGAILLAVIGKIDFAYNLLIAGVVLQIFWLILRRGKF